LGYVELPGVRLYYRMVGEGAAVVMVHGGPGLPHEQLLPFCDRLAGRFRVVYYDQRGCGRSGDPAPPEALEWRDHVADLRGLVAALGLGRFGVFGSSWGALLALLYALADPGAPACLVLVGSTGPRSDGWRELYRAEEARRRAALGTEERLRDLRASGLRERDRAAYDRAWYRLWAEAELADPRRAEVLPPVLMGERGELVNALTQASLGEYDLREALRTLAIPTLVVHGRRDPRPVERAREVAEAIPGAEFAVLEGSGHIPYAEEPEVFFPLVEGFLARHLA
jgi:proline iminopeptidase